MIYIYIYIYISCYYHFEIFPIYNEYDYIAYRYMVTSKDQIRCLNLVQTVQCTAVYDNETIVNKGKCYIVYTGMLSQHSQNEVDRLSQNRSHNSTMMIYHSMLQTGSQIINYNYHSCNNYFCTCFLYFKSKLKTFLFSEYFS